MRRLILAMLVALAVPATSYGYYVANYYMAWRMVYFDTMDIIVIDRDVNLNTGPEGYETCYGVRIIDADHMEVEAAQGYLQVSDGDPAILLDRYQASGGLRARKYVGHIGFHPFTGDMSLVYDPIHGVSDVAGTWFPGQY